MFSHRLMSFLLPPRPPPPCPVFAWPALFLLSLWKNSYSSLKLPQWCCLTCEAPLDSPRQTQTLLLRFPPSASLHCCNDLIASELMACMSVPLRSRAGTAASPCSAHSQLPQRATSAVMQYLCTEWRKRSACLCPESFAFSSPLPPLPVSSGTGSSLGVSLVGGLSPSSALLPFLYAPDSP